MYDQITKAGLANLARQLERVAAGEAGTDAILIAAEALLRVTSPAAVEDREYFRVDLELPRGERCLAEGNNGLVCGRRYQHASTTHRSGELTWAVS